MAKSENPSAVVPNSEEIYCISYLRGLAALGVVLYHVRIGLWVGFNSLMADHALGGWFDRFVAWLSLPTVFMGSGVMLFFVISGFCIHAPYAGPRGKPLDLREYAVRRAFRIYPPYLVAILFAFAVQAFGYHYGLLTSLDAHDYQMAVPMLQNSFATQPECNYALWTIPVEVAFYLFFPLVYFGLKRSSFGTLATGLAVSLLAIASSFWAPIEQSFLPYWFTWIAGAALAEHYRKGDLKSPSLAVIFVAALAFLIGFFCTWHTRLGGYSNQVGLTESFAYGVAFGVLLWWSLLNPWFYQQFPAPAHQSLMFLGTISYSLYLFHLPFFRACSWVWLYCFGQPPINYLVTIPFVLLAVGLAWLIYLSIEAPAHLAGRKLASAIKSRQASRDGRTLNIESTARKVL